MAVVVEEHDSAIDSQATMDGHNMDTSIEESKESAASKVLENPKLVLNMLYTRLDQIKKAYYEMVRSSPDKAASIESLFNVLSFGSVGLGQLRHSTMLSELFYLTSKLISHFHDHIYRCGDVNSTTGAEFQSYDTFYSVLEYAEALIEVSAYHAWGEVGKWVVVAAVQLLKAVIRLHRLLCRNGGIQTSPLIPPISNRDSYCTDANAAQTGNEEYESAWNSASKNTPTRTKGRAWKGPRSGRVLHGLSPRMPDSRTKEEETSLPKLESTGLSSRELFSEVVFSTRPLLHLGTLFAFGENSWKPWLISLAADLYSIKTLKAKRKPTEKESNEIARRQLMLLLYVVRSPFYNRFSKSLITKNLQRVARIIPMASHIVEPLVAYIPIWQRMYSHCWSI